MQKEFLEVVENDRMERDIGAARNVLLEEAKALQNLADTLNADFSHAVDTILGRTGRVIVTGMGKSGHIGAKIAATLASTGTPAFFVHPGEASHGDLGMIAEDDVVIALSHSGESKELGDILAYCSRASIPLIAMTGKPESTLAQAADVVLLNDVKQEACPINMAPTTSTTATLALGDALAVALMERRGFKKEHFARFHPGGKLGSQMAKVADIMVTGDDMPLVTPATTMSDVIIEMTAKNLGGVGVLAEDGTLAGIITDGDLKRHMGDDLLTKKASDIMTANPKTITADDFAVQAVNIMQEKRITSLFVVADDNKPQGVIQIHHCLQAGVI